MSLSIPRLVQHQLKGSVQAFAEASSIHKVSHQKKGQNTSSMSFEVKEATTEEEILACWDVVLSLRTEFKKDNFLAQIQQQHKEGFHLLYTKDPDSGKVVSYIGYRVLTMLYYGKHVYIEDLATLPEFRGKGHATELLNAVKSRAKELGCEVISLASYIGHPSGRRFFLNQGFDISCHHLEIRDIQNKIKY